MLSDGDLMKAKSESRLESACATEKCRKRIRSEFSGSKVAHGQKRHRSLLCKIGLC